MWEFTLLHFQVNVKMFYSLHENKFQMYYSVDLWLYLFAGVCKLHYTILGKVQGLHVGAPDLKYTEVLTHLGGKVAVKYAPISTVTYAIFYVARYSKLRKIHPTEKPAYRSNTVRIIMLEKIYT